MKCSVQRACAVLFLGLTVAVAASGQQIAPRSQAVPPAAQSPFPPLAPQDQQFLDQVLRAWENRSKAVERYRCTFKRWEYDPVFGPRETFKTYSEGLIRYQTPDKGMFKVDKYMDYTPPAQPGGKASYVARTGEVVEHWICDGTSVWEHDYKTKRLIQRELPPQMRGKAIADGPLPFLFGADAEKIKRRYWVRPLPVPAEVKGEYWLEAYPKTRQDAANFQKVHVIIDQTDFLPKGLVLFDKNFNARTNPARTTFTFENRDVNWSIALDRINIWKPQFFEPPTPFGWKKVVEKYEAPEPGESLAPATVPPPVPVSQAQRTGPRGDRGTR
jgi:TIGR03009 family protein